MAKPKKLKMKFDTIVAPMKKLMTNLEVYMDQCNEAKKVNITTIDELVVENTLIDTEALKSATTVKQLKIMLGDEVSVDALPVVTEDEPEA